ncbi:hypothetical protein GY45DRAFT_287964 [Cubamyces sp. BRFM 1775]|nr:hypothetical protein GY45DRAFT_287964 [Cubamyces sp. BRFM 1775]
MIEHRQRRCGQRCAMVRQAMLLFSWRPERSWIDYPSAVHLLSPMQSRFAKRGRLTPSSPSTYWVAQCPDLEKADGALKGLQCLVRKIVYLGKQPGQPLSRLKRFVPLVCGPSTSSKRRLDSLVHRSPTRTTRERYLWSARRFDQLHDPRNGGGLVEISLFVSRKRVMIICICRNATRLAEEKDLGNR